MGISLSQGRLDGSISHPLIRQRRKQIVDFRRHIYHSSGDCLALAPPASENSLLLLTPLLVSAHGLCSSSVMISRPTLSVRPRAAMQSPASSIRFHVWTM